MFTTMISGGPSSASSGVCSCPMCRKSQITILRSVPADANIGSSWGLQATCVISPSCSSIECNFVSILRISNKPTVYDTHESSRPEITPSSRTLSELPVASIQSLLGWKATELISPWWACTRCTGLTGSRLSQLKCVCVCVCVSPQPSACHPQRAPYIINFISSATDANKDSLAEFQLTSWHEAYIQSDTSEYLFAAWFVASFVYYLPPHNPYDPHISDKVAIPYHYWVSYRYP